MYITGIKLNRVFLTKNVLIEMSFININKKNIGLINIRFIPIHLIFSNN